MQRKMLYLITGGSGSGKSEYAEKIAVSWHKSEFSDGNLYYIAAMYPYDDECRARIKRHRAMRSGKGFQTIECFTHLEAVDAGSGDVVLLECMSNLLANEMYREEGQIKARGEEGERQLKTVILDEVLRLEKQAGCLIVVTNEVFSDGAAYEEDTEEYLRFLGQINVSLARSADVVREIVYSIPVAIKG